MPEDDKGRWRIKELLNGIQEVRGSNSLWLHQVVPQRTDLPSNFDNLSGSPLSSPQALCQAIGLLGRFWLCAQVQIQGRTTTHVELVSPRSHGGNGGWNPPGDASDFYELRRVPWPISNRQASFAENFTLCIGHVVRRTSNGRQCEAFIYTSNCSDSDKPFTQAHRRTLAPAVTAHRRGPPCRRGPYRHHVTGYRHLACPAPGKCLLPQ